MSASLLNKVHAKFANKKLPEVNVGDTVVVDTIIRDKDKQRIQKFKGIVISVRGAGTDKTFTVRKISYGVGVEKILPFHSPNISNIEIVKHAKVRRAKLYYMRDRVGKAAMKLKAGEAVIPMEGSFEEVTEETIVETPAEEVTESTTEVVAEAPVTE